MTIIGLSLISFFLTPAEPAESIVLIGNFEDANFWHVFAIFFPAVTGFTQGVSMSGDLKDAGKSLPLGTFLAVGLSVVVYFGIAIVFAAALPGSVLRGDYGAMKRVATFGAFIDALKMPQLEV